jgi:hypothetical protein
MVAGSCPSVTSTSAQPLSVCEGHPTLGVAGAGVGLVHFGCFSRKKRWFGLWFVHRARTTETNYKLSPQSLAMAISMARAFVAMAVGPVGMDTRGFRIRWI